MENKHKQTYGILSIFSISVVGASELAKHPHILITRANQHIQEINIHLYGTINPFVPMISAENQKQN